MARQLTRAARRAGVVARVLGRCFSYLQFAGARLALGQNINAPALRIVDDPPALVPVDEGWWYRRLHGDACQIDVTARLHKQLGVAEDFRLRH